MRNDERRKRKPSKAFSRVGLVRKTPRIGLDNRFSVRLSYEGGRTSGSVWTGVARRSIGGGIRRAPVGSVPRTAYRHSSTTSDVVTYLAELIRGAVPGTA